MFNYFGRARSIYGIIVIVVHLLLYAPFLVWANRIEPMFAGYPYLLVYLWVVYIVVFFIYLFGSWAVDKEEGLD